MSILLAACSVPSAQTIDGTHTAMFSAAKLQVCGCSRSEAVVVNASIPLTPKKSCSWAEPPVTPGNLIGSSLAVWSSAQVVSRLPSDMGTPARAVLGATTAAATIAVAARVLRGLRLRRMGALDSSSAILPGYPQTSMAHQYIFQMYRLSKVYPPDKTVLKDITLAFLPGAKIGVLGYNGAGKSTVLRIMAGRDTEVRGDAQLAPAATVGLLEQEPELDEDRTVL